MATGKYHKHNYLKFLIFRELWEIYPKSMTYNEIAEIIGVEKSKVASMLKSYRHYGYVGRRKGREAKTNRLMYKYKLNILGVQTYLQLKPLHDMGRELNLRKLQRGKPLQKIDSYIGDTRTSCELDA